MPFPPSLLSFYFIYWNVVLSLGIELQMTFEAGLVLEDVISANFAYYITLVSYLARTRLCYDAFLPSRHG